MTRRALLLDRDGTLIVDVGYPRDPAQVEPLPGAIDALHGLQARFALVIVSNQSGIGRGLVTPAEAALVHDRTIAVFARAGIHFAGAYYCPLPQSVSRALALAIRTTQDPETVIAAARREISQIDPEN